MNGGSILFIFGLLLIWGRIGYLEMRTSVPLLSWHNAAYFGPGIFCLILGGLLLQRPSFRSRSQRQILTGCRIWWPAGKRYNG